MPMTALDPAMKHLLSDDTLDKGDSLNNRPLSVCASLALSALFQVLFIGGTHCRPECRREDAGASSE